MNFWWVNQNKTYAQEVLGGYMWSPQRNSNGAFNQYYENMRFVRPGDIVFSYRKTRIPALGRILSVGREAPKPDEFGEAGANWDAIGWRVEVDYIELANGIRPKEFIDLLRPHLPEKYSPITKSGDGLQSVYLAAVPKGMAETLLQLLGPEASAIANFEVVVDNEEVEERVLQRIEKELTTQPGIEETEKQAVIKARRGQGKFRELVLLREPACRVTGVDDPSLLIASHIKPWAHCASHSERLDQDNGLMLTPTIDHLFDKGFISFSDEGLLLVSSMLSVETCRRLGVEPHKSAGAFNERQKAYLAYHRREIFEQ